MWPNTLSEVRVSLLNLLMRADIFRTPVMFEGDFEDSYTKADNSPVVATDTSQHPLVLKTGLQLICHLSNSEEYYLWSVT